VLFGCDGVAGEETVVRFENCRLATRLFQIGTPILRIPRTTMLLARTTPRKTMTMITARRDMKALQPLLAVSVNTNLQLSRKIWLYSGFGTCQLPSVSAAIPNGRGATHESIHLYLCFPGFDRATVRLGGKTKIGRRRQRRRALRGQYGVPSRSPFRWRVASRRRSTACWWKRSIESHHHGSAQFRKQQCSVRSTRRSHATRGKRQSTWPATWLRRTSS
jgi:hypothetical protein